MYKVIEPAAWDFTDKLAQLVKVPSGGLRGNDLRTFIKRAGHNFADVLQNVELAPGEVPVHQIVVGATESFGANRNGDGFPADVCRDRAWTFEKFGRVYRNHKSHDPGDSYGRIIKAAFYEPMQRIELLIGLNGSEAAARANGGKVADKEMEKLASGQELPFSMGCRVPYDTCSGCGNVAKNKNYYCTEDTCKYGGLKHNITKVASDGHVLHAINPQGTTFFDDSVVFRPADRTAYAFGRMMTKVAGTPMSGAELAIVHGLMAPMEIILGDESMAELSFEARELCKLACEMAREDTHWQKFAHVGTAFMVARPIADFPEVNTQHELTQAVSALAMRKIALPVRDFLAMILHNNKQAEEVAPLVQARLPGVYDRLVKSAAVIQDNPYLATAHFVSGKWNEWADKLAADFSMSDEFVRRRMQVAAIRGITFPIKVASADPQFETLDCGEEKLAQQYALYQLGFLTALKRARDPEFLKIASFTCVGNRVF